MELVDFTNCHTSKKAYEGANGSKLSIIYEGERYMLKFPSLSKRNKNMSYINGTVSEYLGCHIMESLGFETQKTIMGIYRYNGKEKIVVACKDFTSAEHQLQNFAALKNAVIESSQSGYNTELSDVLYAIRKQDSFDQVLLEIFFWDMFIGDALIGNWDRHNKNWGFLYNYNTDRIEKIAPIYDCGSSMFPSADDETVKKVLTDESELLTLVYEQSCSALLENGEHINYFNFISSLKQKECNNALKRIYPRINMQKINSIIEDTPCITQQQKSFFKSIVKARKELILEHSYNKLISYEREIKENIKPKNSRADDF